MWLSCRDVPKCAESAVVARCQQLTIRTPRDIIHSYSLADGSTLWLAGRYIPENDIAVVAPRGQRLAVRAPRQAANAMSVPLERTAVRLAGGDVPEDDGLVGAAAA